jgi:hypothetical protein
LPLFPVANIRGVRDRSPEEDTTVAHVVERRLPLPEQVSIARLHGEACIGCGRTPTKEHPLTAAGTIDVPDAEGVPHSWPVVTCPDCTLRETP